MECLVKLAEISVILFKLTGEFGAYLLNNGDFSGLSKFIFDSLNNPNVYIAV